MYILIVSRGYPSHTYKRNGIFEFDQAKALTKLGHKVVYAAIDMRSARRKRKWGFESLEKEGVIIEAINVPIGALSKRLLRISRVIALEELYKKVLRTHGKPDIIHAHFIDLGYSTVKAFENCNLPIVLTEHFSEMNQKNISADMKKIGNYTYPRVDKLITVSNHLSKNIEHHFGIQSTVIPNIVDIEKFSYKQKNNKMSKSSFSFISIGNLTSNKRMDYLIDAFYKAFGDNKSIKLYIFGEGPEKAKLIELIRKYKCENKIFLKGQVDRSCIAKQMEECDCFVLASKTETFGVAYIEAMAMGLPVISTRCGGPESFINDKNGVLVSVDDLSDLVSTMIFMHKNIQYYDREFIASRAKQQYSSDTIAKELVAIYSNFL